MHQYSIFTIVIITFVFVQVAFNSLLGVQNNSANTVSTVNNDSSQSIMVDANENTTEHFYGGIKYF